MKIRKRDQLHCRNVLTFMEALYFGWFAGILWMKATQE